MQWNVVYNNVDIKNYGHLPQKFNDFSWWLLAQMSIFRYDVIIVLKVNKPVSA